MTSPTTSPAIQPAGTNKVDKPWGYELRWAITDKYLGKILHINKGAELSLQYHVEKDESIFVIDGLLDLLLEDDNGEMGLYRLTPGMSARVKPGKKHRYIGAEDVNLIEVSTPQMDDVVRLEDDYGRTGTTEN